MQENKTKIQGKAQSPQSETLFRSFSRSSLAFHVGPVASISYLRREQKEIKSDKVGGGEAFRGCRGEGEKSKFSPRSESGTVQTGATASEQT